MDTKVNLVIYPDQRLKTNSKDIENYDDELRFILKKMQVATHFYNGIGLAGVQIGYMIRAIYIDYNSIVKYEGYKDTRSTPLFITNPVILDSSKETFSSKEGCVSMPGVQVEVQRAKYVKVEYQDEYGQSQSIETEIPLLSACLQHEIDHINGFTLAQRLIAQNSNGSAHKDAMIIKKITKFLKSKSFPLSFDIEHECDKDCAHH